MNDHSYNHSFLYSHVVFIYNALMQFLNLKIIIHFLCLALCKEISHVRLLIGEVE